jgi:putative ABC transport system substrate-binding protein
MDKILKRAEAAKLPVEQATRFELVISLKMARAVGLIIAKSVLVQVDEVIE